MKTEKALKGKRLDALIGSTFSELGHGIQFSIWNLGKIDKATRAAYEAATTGKVEAMREAMKLAIVEWRLA